jgi:murein DD-endopeptidase MepM/ murein hydrolase activator NlpD
MSNSEQPSDPSVPPVFPRRHLFAAAALAVLLALAGVIAPDGAGQARADIPATSLDAVAGPAVPAPVPIAPAIEPAPEPAAPEPAWADVRVRSGDSLARIFQREDLRAADLQAVLDSDAAARRLARIHPGDRLQYRVDDDGRLLALRYEFSRLEAMDAARPDADADFTTRLVEREPERRLAVRSATIDSSLFLASTRAGLDDATAMDLASIFQWDIDFVLDIRSGDAFDLVFEELWLDGEKIGNGEILAARFTNRGNVFEAVRYTDREGFSSYYTPDGLNMRKAFLRAPVSFSRISSNFNMRRRHPIHNTARPHRGIDYAAPTGTPVVAAGDGKVTLVKRNHYASGNYVVIKHGETYETKYLHLSRFARGMRTGQRVSQGDVIGYVGATGWATGPHLHYEFLVHGVHQNPRTVDLPKALPIAESERPRFVETTRSLIARLDGADDGTRIALGEAAAAAGGP